MKSYKTVRKKGSKEIIIEKSKFIAYVSPVETKEEAEEFIREIKKKHRDATHNVPAMVIGDQFQIQWASDDGEPQGTSGPPIVQMLVSSGITNLAVVVTRYFGGIKLGTGGLVRAYTSAAKSAIEEAEVCQVEERELLTYIIDYSYLSKLKSLSEEGNFQIVNLVYTDKVEVVISTKFIDVEDTMSIISNVTLGKEVLKKREKKMVKF